MIAHLAPNTSWTLDPLQIVPTLVMAALYTRRVLTLRDRGTPVPAWRIALFAVGILTLLVAFVSPVHALGELLGVAYDEENVVVGETLVRFVPGGPQGRPQLHAELFV